MAESEASVAQGLPDLRVRVLDGHKVEYGAGKNRKTVEYDDEAEIVLPAGEALHLLALGAVEIVGSA